MSTESTSADLLILGAGPAGLAAAWRAAKSGRSVIVLEAAPRVGGMAASFEVAGVRVDVGSHRLHPATPPHLLADLRHLLGDDLQTRPRHGRLRVAQDWVGFPLRPVELARALPPRLLAGLVRDTLTGPLRKPQRDTFAEVLKAGLGPALYEALYAPYARKLWGLDGDEIDGEQARRRVTADTPWKVLAKMLRHNRATSGHSGPGQGRIFHYPRRGFGQIVEALAQAATDAGADIRTGTAVARVLPDAASPSVLLGDGTKLTARQIFSTVPLPRLAQLADPPAPAEQLAAARELTFRAMTLVYVVHEGGRWTEYDAHYLPGPQSPITRISEPANYRISTEDPSDRTVLCAELPCDPDDEWHTASPDDLGALVAEAAARTGLPAPRIGAVEVLRLRTVYPIYRLGYAARLAPLDDWARALPGVTTFGRLGLFAHDNTHHALAMAYEAVAALGPDGFDHRAWVAARARFDTHVVED